MHDEVEATDRRCGNGHAPVFFPKPMNGVESFVGFAGVASNDQDVWHALAAILSAEELPFDVVGGHYGSVAARRSA